MIISLQLTNIRSFKKASFEFKQGINLIIGSNGSGKTTILESIGLMAFGKYLSINQDIYAIRNKEEAGRVEAKLDGDEKREVEIGFSKQEKIISLDGVKSPVSALIGLLPQVFFNPETVELVFDSPALRRRELDMVLTQADRNFVMEILNFRKILKQRNALLRSVGLRRAAPEELGFWNERFVELGLKIFASRDKLIKFFNKNLAEIFNNLSQKGENLSLKYLPSGDYERFEEVLYARQQMDIENGLTSVGPHRDDFVFLLEKHSMREGASRGEQRLAAVAFKAAAADHLIGEGIRPIIILDDIFSELDPVRKEAVAEALRIFKVDQVFISATDERGVPEILKKNANIIRLKNDNQG